MEIYNLRENFSPGWHVRKPQYQAYKLSPELLARAVHNTLQTFMLLLFPLSAPRGGRKVPTAEDTMCFRNRAQRSLSWNSLESSPQGPAFMVTQVTTKTSKGGKPSTVLPSHDSCEPQHWALQGHSSGTLMLEVNNNALIEPKTLSSMGKSYLILKA